MAIIDYMLRKQDLQDPFLFDTDISFEFCDRFSGSYLNSFVQNGLYGDDKKVDCFYINRVYLQIYNKPDSVDFCNNYFFRSRCERHDFNLRMIGTLQDIKYFETVIAEKGFSLEKACDVTEKEEKEAKP
jgi:hypothetical protein